MPVPFLIGTIIYFSIMILPKRAANTTDSGGTDESTGDLLLGVLWSLAGLSTIVLTLRLYTAAFILRRIRLHDYLMVMALVGCSAIFATGWATFSSDLPSK